MTRRNRPGTMTATEARELLGVSRGTLARMLRDGRLPSELDPLDKRRRIIQRADVLALLGDAGAPIEQERPADRRGPATQADVAAALDRLGRPDGGTGLAAG